MSRFRISCHSKHCNTPIPISNLCDRDQPTSEADRQTDRQRTLQCIAW